MGMLMSRSMDQAMEKNRKMMEEMQNNMFERQMQMQNYMREQAAAMQLARAREMFRWTASGYATISGLALLGFMRKKNPAVIVPLVPLGFIVGYQYHLAHGDKLQWIRREAGQIVTEEGWLLRLPSGLPTLRLLDLRRAGHPAVQADLTEQEARVADSV